MGFVRPTFACFCARRACLSLSLSLRCICAALRFWCCSLAVSVKHAQFHSFKSGTKDQTRVSGRTKENFESLSLSSCATLQGSVPDSSGEGFSASPALPLIVPDALRAHPRPLPSAFRKAGGVQRVLAIIKRLHRGSPSVPAGRKVSEGRTREELMQLLALILQDDDLVPS